MNSMIILGNCGATQLPQLEVTKLKKDTPP